MTTSAKLGWGLAAILAVALGAMSYTFLVAGKTTPYADGRTTVLLSKDERNKVLGEMRGLLEGAQEIVEASVEGDMVRVSEVARSIGMAAAEGESAQLIGKLPLEFKTLGLDTHRAMDDLAALAQTTDDPLVVLGALGDAMLNCTSCHAGYRLGVEGLDSAE